MYNACPVTVQECTVEVNFIGFAAGQTVGFLKVRRELAANRKRLTTIN